MNNIILTILNSLGLIKWETNYRHDRHVLHYLDHCHQRFNLEIEALRENYMYDMKQAYGNKDWFSEEDYIRYMNNNWRLDESVRCPYSEI